MKQRLQISALLLSMMLMGQFAFSQAGIEWQRLLGGSAEEKTSRIVQTADSGFIAIGYTFSSDFDIIGAHGNADIWVTKLSKNGALEWAKTFGGSNADLGTSICQTQDGNYVFTGMSKSNDGDVTLNRGNEDFWVVKIDAIGNILWQKSYGGSYADFPLNIIETADNMLVVNGYTVSNDFDVSGNHGGTDVWVIKLNAIGSLVWQHAFGGNGSEIASQLIETPDYGYLFTGYTTSDTFDITSNHGGADIWNVKLDSAGSLTWQKTYGGSADENAFAIKKTVDNNYVVAGWTASNNGDVSGNNGGIADEWVIEVDNSGTLLWQQCIGGTNEDRGYDIIQNTDSTLITVGFTNTYISHGNYEAWICKLTKTGHLVYRNSIGGSQIDVANCITPTFDHHFILGCYTNSIDGDVAGGHGDYDFWMSKINDPVRNISGKVFADMNANCLLDTSDIGLHHVIFRDAVSGNYIMSDHNGDYLFPMYNDSVRLYITNLDTIFSLACLTSDTLFVVNDTAAISDLRHADFPVTSSTFCHRLQIDVSTSFFRTCRMGDIYLSYENEGTIQANGAFIVVEIDTAIIDSIYSIFPYTQIGDTLLFNLGIVDAHARGDIRFEGHAKCSAVGHSSNCVRAYIYPPSNCALPNAGYDTSDIVVETSCHIDTVKVLLRNRSSHDMREPGSLRAYEDEIIQRIDTFILVAGGTTEFNYYTPTDQTSTMIVNQNPYHPRNPSLIRFDELCALTTPIIGHSIVNEFPRYDNAADYEEFCQIIGNSWDPNIKMVSPSGFTNRHFTDSNQVLEYRIDFQNTGSDTAFKVVIVDTLDFNLDINTFKPLIGSSTYTPILEGNRTVKFVFDPIILPDSNHSEPNSHGFVTYKIRPVRGVAKGTVINNYGDIYFDYNPAVRTNKIFNTIFDTVLINVGIVDVKEDLIPSVLVFPNPAAEKFFVKTNSTLVNAKIVFTDVAGKEIFEMNQLSGNVQEVQLPALLPGVYFINIYEKNNFLIGKSKLIVQQYK
jgi:uncharacterized repeat protein (TIGR01451 family)